VAQLSTNNKMFLACIPMEALSALKNTVKMVTQLTFQTWLTNGDILQVRLQLTTVVIRTGRFVLLYIPKTSCYFCHFFSCKWLFQEYCGPGLEVLNKLCGKPRSEEQCIWYNSTLFIWMIFQNWMKWTIIVGKRCIQEQWLEVSLYFNVTL
jgi:hypothetical protein